jgi:hypothetical protein
MAWTLQLAATVRVGRDADVLREIWSNHVKPAVEACPFVLQRSEGDEPFSTDGIFKTQEQRIWASWASTVAAWAAHFDPSLRVRGDDGEAASAPPQELPPPGWTLAPKTPDDSVLMGREELLRREVSLDEEREAKAQAREHHEREAQAREAEERAKAAVELSAIEFAHEYRPSATRALPSLAGVFRRGIRFLAGAIAALISPFLVTFSGSRQPLPLPSPGEGKRGL